MTSPKTLSVATVTDFNASAGQSLVVNYNHNLIPTTSQPRLIYINLDASASQTPPYPTLAAYLQAHHESTIEKIPLDQDHTTTTPFPRIHLNEKRFSSVQYRWQ